MYRNLAPGAIGVSCSLEEALRLAPLGGFEGVDLDLGAARRLGDPRDVAQRFRDANLEIGGFGLPAAWNAEAAEYRQSLRDLGPAAEYASAAGCTRTCTWVPSWSDEMTFEQAFEWHVGRFKPIARTLRENGCRLGLEFLGTRTLLKGHTHEFITTMDGMLELCRAVGDNVGLLLDAWHWYTSGGTLDDLRRLSDADVVYVHINDAPEGVPVNEQIDSVRRLPGETGVIDLAGFLQALREIGCTAPVTPEPFAAHLSELPAEQAVRTVGDGLAKVWRAAGL